MRCKMLVIQQKTPEMPHLITEGKGSPTVRSEFPERFYVLSQLYDVISKSVLFRKLWNFHSWRLISR